MVVQILFVCDIQAHAHQLKVQGYWLRFKKAVSFNRTGTGCTFMICIASAKCTKRGEN